MQNALPCDKPHKGGRDSTVHIQTGPQTAPSAPKSMQQRDAGHAPRVLPSSAAQLPVDAALNAHGLTLLMVLLYAFFRPIATTTPIIFPNSRGRFLAGCTIPAYTKSPPGRLDPIIVPARGPFHSVRICPGSVASGGQIVYTVTRFLFAEGGVHMSVLCLGEVWLELNAATAPELTETFRAQTGGWGAS